MSVEGVLGCGVIEDLVEHGMADFLPCSTKFSMTYFLPCFCAGGAGDHFHSNYGIARCFASHISVKSWLLW